MICWAVIFCTWFAFFWRASIESNSPYASAFLRCNLKEHLSQTLSLLQFSSWQIWPPVFALWLSPSWGSQEGLWDHRYGKRKCEISSSKFFPFFTKLFWKFAYIFCLFWWLAKAKNVYSVKGKSFSSSFKICFMVKVNQKYNNVNF